jgi:hypothetical protein
MVPDQTLMEPVLQSWSPRLVSPTGGSESKAGGGVTAVALVLLAVNVMRLLSKCLSPNSLGCTISPVYTPSTPCAARPASGRAFGAYRGNTRARTPHPRATMTRSIVFMM